MKPDILYLQRSGFLVYKHCHGDVHSATGVPFLCHIAVHMFHSSVLLVHTLEEAVLKAGYLTPLTIT